MLETHGHWDHIQAVPAVRDAGYRVGVTAEDAEMLASYDDVLEDESVIEVGRLRLRTILTPGHTQGSMCFRLEGHPVLFSGDTLFPGGPGNTKFEAATSPRSSAPIEDRLFSPIAGRHDRAARPRRRHHDRHRAPPPPGVDRPGLVAGTFDPMELLEAIKSRRSISRLSPPAPTAAELRLILDAAVCAPDHGIAAPWRFIVLRDEAKDAFGPVLAAATEAEYRDRGQEPEPAKVQKDRTKMDRAPLVVVVVCEYQPDREDPRSEQHAAVVAAAQNACLAATDLGYGSMWRTGPNA